VPSGQSAIGQIDRLRLPRSWGAKAAGGLTIRRRLPACPTSHPINLIGFLSLSAFFPFQNPIKLIGRQDRQRHISLAALQPDAPYWEWRQKLV
jgi:hypothetical protein